MPALITGLTGTGAITAITDIKITITTAITADTATAIINTGRIIKSTVDTTTITITIITIPTGHIINPGITGTKITN